MKKKTLMAILMGLTSLSAFADDCGHVTVVRAFNSDFGLEVTLDNGTRFEVNGQMGSQAAVVQMAVAANKVLCRSVDENNYKTFYIKL